MNIDPGPAPDAGASLMGVYGIANPMMIWLLNRRPDLIAMTPTEWRTPIDIRHPPTCGALVEQGRRDLGDVGPGERNAFLAFGYRCERQMVFRYVLGRPAWVCFAHSGDDPDYRFEYRFIKPPTPALQETPDFDLWAELGRALEGKSRDLVFDQGEWHLL